jgi:RNA polymerase sigma-70 factor (ECF subfamily)
MQQKEKYSDDQLLRRISNGDQEAFSILYNYYWESLFTSAAQALRSYEEAADIIQEVFLSIWQRRGELHISGSLAAYLQTSVRYKAIRVIERNINRRDYLAMLNETASHLWNDSQENAMNLKEVQKVIHEVVETMPPKMQEAYILSREENLSHKEIAQRMGISTETVKKHLQHALSLIKKALAHHSLLVVLAITSETL